MYCERRQCCVDRAAPMLSISVTLTGHWSGASSSSGHLGPNAARDTFGGVLTLPACVRTQDKLQDLAARGPEIWPQGEMSAALSLGHRQLGRKGRRSVDTLDTELLSYILQPTHPRIVILKGSSNCLDRM